VIAELGYDRVPRWFAGREGRASELVRVDDLGPASREEPREGGLTGSDPAGETRDEQR